MFFNLRRIFNLVSGLYSIIFMKIGDDCVFLECDGGFLATSVVSTHIHGDFLKRHQWWRVMTVRDDVLQRWSNPISFKCGWFQRLTVFSLSCRVSFRFNRCLCWIVHNTNNPFFHICRVWDPGIVMIRNSVTNWEHKPMYQHYLDENGDFAEPYVDVGKQRWVEEPFIRFLLLCCKNQKAKKFGDKETLHWNEEMKCLKFYSMKEIINRYTNLLARVKPSWDRFERNTKSKYIIMTLIRKFWYHNVDISELLLKASGFVMQCANWRFSQEMQPTHTIRIRAKIKYEEGK